VIQKRIKNFGLFCKARKKIKMEWEEFCNETN
jgi:hypothetical protein